MHRMFKRSFIGYDLNSVQQEIDRISAEYETRIKEFKDELTNQTHQRKLLRTEYEKLKQDIEERLNIQNSIKDKLYDKYIVVAEKRLDAERRMEEATTELKEQVKLKQIVLARYKDYQTNIKSDMFRIRDRFENILDGEGIEEP